MASPSTALRIEIAGGDQAVPIQQAGRKKTQGDDAQPSPVFGRPIFAANKMDYCFNIKHLNHLMHLNPIYGPILADQYVGSF